MLLVLSFWHYANEQEMHHTVVGGMGRDARTITWNMDFFDSFLKKFDRTLKYHIPTLEFVFFPTRFPECFYLKLSDFFVAKKNKEPTRV